VDAFQGFYRLAEYKSAAEAILRDVDFLFLPTTGAIYTHEQIATGPVELNSNLGYYTNFVNLLDLAAVAVPAGFRPNGVPFGASVIGPAFSDYALLQIAALFLDDPLPPEADLSFVELAVVGAHLSGQPLNHQLISRGAKLVRNARTAPGYRLYALANTSPPKPGLVRDPAFAGPGIELETWAVPASRFGSFVAGVPAPLGIGTCTLDDGTEVKAFICEQYALGGAREITSFGGWRSYRASI
jgi:allophanate hydrolase